LATYPLFWFGIGKKYPFLLLGAGGLSIGAWFWGAVSLAWVGALFVPRTWQALVKTPRGENIFNAWILLGLVCTAGFDLLQWLRFRDLGYPIPIGLLIADVALGLIVWAKRRDPNLIALACLVAVMHKVGSVLTFPLVAERSDMLPTILQALERWMTGGKAYAPPTGGIGQMHYLPLTWMSYSPAYFLNMDPRWIGVFYLSLLGLLAERWLKETKDSLGAKLVVLWFLNPYLAFRHELYLDFFWLSIAATTIAAMMERPGWTALFSGLTLVTMPWAWIVAPFWWLLASRSAPWHRLASVAAISVFVASIVLTPFLLHERSLFLDAFLLPFRLIQRGDYAGELSFGVAALFYQLGWSRILQPLQIIMLMTFGVVGLTMRRRGAALLGLMVAAFFLFVILNPFIENYFYLASLMMAALALRPLSAQHEEAQSIPSDLGGHEY